MSSEDCPCLLAVFLVLGLILLAEQALIGLSAKKKEIDGDKTNFQRVEEPDMESDWDLEILVPFPNSDRNTCHGIVDCQERGAMGKGDTIVGGEVPSEVGGRSQVE